jgi:acyl-coenzyme A synthetase/AMP-(fatty) acid ligase
VGVGPTEAGALRRWLAERLPAGHCPTRISLVAALPRTAAGKVNRAELSAS